MVPRPLLEDVYMPDSCILGIQSTGEALQKRVLLRLGRSRTATRHGISYGTLLEYVVNFWM